MSPDVCVASPRIGTNTGVFSREQLSFICTRVKTIHVQLLYCSLFAFCSHAVVDVFGRLLGLGQNVAWVRYAFMSRYSRFTKGRYLDYCAVIAVYRPFAY